MNLDPENKLHRTLIYLGKVSVTVFLYYLFAEFSHYFEFIEILNHEDYTVYWPPSGIVLGLMMIWGKSIWPGIVIATILRTSSSLWFLSGGSEFFETAIVISFFSVGRLLEPFVGLFLMKKTGILNEPFKNPKHVFYFILIILLVSVISAAFADLGTNLLRNDSMRVVLIRIAGWYIENIIGMMIFVPATYAVFQSIRAKSNPIILIIIGSITLLIIAVFLPVPYVNILPVVRFSVIENTLSFLIIPILLWVGFRFSLIVNSYLVFVISVTAIYLTSLGHGPFVTPGNNIGETVWLLQWFLFIMSTSSLFSYALSNELKENTTQRAKQTLELKQAQKMLLYTMKDREKAKAKAEESDRLKSSFIATMSHEIRTPMNAIMGISELLDRAYITEEKRNELTLVMKEQSENLLAIINDILLISQLESNPKKQILIRTDLAVLFEELKVAYAGKSKHKKDKEITIGYSISLNHPDPVISADVFNLKIVLSNLIDNAMKFTQHGGIEFSCVQQDADTLLFTVSDTGVGIPADKFDSIFKPFSYAHEDTHLKHGGTGLGLAICKILVTNWGGKIQVASTMGQGSSFSFTMPLNRESDSESQTASTITPAPGS